MDEHRTNTFLIAAIAIVAIVALVVLVLVYVQTTRSSEGKVVYDVVDKDGNVIGYAVDDNVFIYEKTATGQVITQQLTKQSLDTRFPGASLKTRTGGNQFPGTGGCGPTGC